MRYDKTILWTSVKSGAIFYVILMKAQNRDTWQALVYKVMNLQVLQKVWNFLSSGEPVSFSRRTLLHGVSWIPHKNNSRTSFYSD